MEVEQILNKLCKGPLFPRPGFNELEARFLDMFHAAIQPAGTVLPGESAAVSFDRPRTTALFFDKIWCAYGSVPEDLAFGGNTDFEKVLLICNVLLEAVEHTNQLVTRNGLPDSAHLDMFRQKCLATIRKAGFSEFIYKDSNVWPNINNLTHFLGDYFAKRYSIAVTPIYSGTGIIDTEYSPGNKEIVIHSLSEIDVLDEAKIEWQQVYEFRKDHEAKRKLHRMMHWLDADMVGKSANFIQDELNIRLEDYQWTIRKHGLKTISGSISSILGLAELTAAATVTTAVTLTSTPLWGLLSGAGVIVGKIAVNIAEMAIEYDGAKSGPNTEIAFIYDVKKKFRDKDTQKGYSILHVPDSSKFQTKKERE